jgi:hypothetical protein
MPSSSFPQNRTVAGRTDERTKASGGRRIRRAFLACALALGAVAAVVSGGSPASAATAYKFKFVSSELDLDTDNFSSGSRIIQKLGAYQRITQKWTVTPAANGTVVIRNAATNMCLNTDGVPGHWLTQEANCNLAGEVWTMKQVGFNPDYGFPVYTITSYFYGLNVDVSGDSREDYANVIAWYPVGGVNQNLMQFVI